uniref:Uncharacterized protein n=1 Tax=Picea glauca TaxID=3330 RepID=A0A101LUD1_PICGL|nr:hypothetical protein ABT39_MTgene3401 [Picea glauca]
MVTDVANTLCPIDLALLLGITTNGRCCQPPYSTISLPVPPIFVPLQCPIHTVFLSHLTTVPSQQQFILPIREKHQAITYPL